MLRVFSLFHFIQFKERKEGKGNETLNLFNLLMDVLLNGLSICRLLTLAGIAPVVEGNHEDDSKEG